MKRALFTIFVTSLVLTVGLSGSFPSAKADGSVRVLSDTGYLDSSGNYYVVGEVQNTGSQAVNFVQVTAKFYDANGIFIDSRFDLTLLYVIPAGRKSPFQLALLDVSESAKVNHYSLSVTYLPTADLPPKLEIMQDINFTDASGNLHVEGSFKNQGDETLVNAKVVTTYYDASSRVVAAELLGFDPDVTGDITPGQTVQFEIVLDKSRAQYAQTYVLAVESNQYTTIPEFPTGIVLFILAILSTAVSVRRTKLNVRRPR